MKRRRYRLGQRAEKQAETRARIVEATVALHEEVGPRATTISAIAQRAGVQRLTVYRYFPDDGSLFRACGARFLELHPPPDPAAWGNIEDAAERTRAALAALYAYYRRTADMFDRVYRDADLLPALREVVDGFESGYLAPVATALARGHRARGAARRRLDALLGHAVRFSTWRSLSALGLDEREAATLMAACPGGLAAPSRA